MFKTKDDVFEFLKSYEELHYDRVFCSNKATSVHGIDYSKEMVQGSGDNSLSTIEIFANRAIEDEKRMLDIETFVADNFKGKALTIIWGHYIDFKSYEEIAQEMNYAKDSLFKIQRVAIENYIIEEEKKRNEYY